MIHQIQVQGRAQETLNTIIDLIHDSKEITMGTGLGDTKLVEKELTKSLIFTHLSCGYKVIVEGNIITIDNGGTLFKNIKFTCE